MEPSTFLGESASDRGHIYSSGEINHDRIQRNHCNPTGLTWESYNAVTQGIPIMRDIPVTAADQMQLTTTDSYIDAFNSQFPDPERAHDRQSGVIDDGLVPRADATITPDLPGPEPDDEWPETDPVTVHERPTKRQRRGRSQSSSKSLDMSQHYTSQLFGPSGESDPYLLNLYPYDKNQEFRFSKVVYRRLEEEASSASRILPAHFLLSHTSITAAAQARSESDATGVSNESEDRKELDRLISEDHRVPLFEMYVPLSVSVFCMLIEIYRFIDHVFDVLPVVSRSRFYADPEKSIAEMPTALLAAIYATALPFSAWDDKLCVEDVYSSPPTEVVWRIAHRCFIREMSCARLSTVQAAILVLHRPVASQLVADPPTSWVSVTSALAVAQSLGLHMDPGGWDLSGWEIRLRRRLWWTLFAEEKWRALTYGRPSHLQLDDWHVTVLTEKDFELDFETPSQPAVHQLVLMSSLTMIVDEIYQAF